MRRIILFVLLCVVTGITLLLVFLTRKGSTPSLPFPRVVRVPVRTDKPLHQNKRVLFNRYMHSKRTKKEIADYLTSVMPDFLSSQPVFLQTNTEFIPAWCNLLSQNRDVFLYWNGLMAIILPRLHFEESRSYTPDELIHIHRCGNHFSFLSLCLFLVYTEDIVFESVILEERNFSMIKGYCSRERACTNNPQQTLSQIAKHWGLDKIWAQQPIIRVWYGEHIQYDPSTPSHNDRISFSQFSEIFEGVTHTRGWLGYDEKRHDRAGYTVNSQVVDTSAHSTSNLILTQNPDTLLGEIYILEGLNSLVHEMGHIASPDTLFQTAQSDEKPYALVVERYRQEFKKIENRRTFIQKKIYTESGPNYSTEWNPIELFAHQVEEITYHLLGPIIREYAIRRLNLLIDQYPKPPFSYHIPSMLERNYTVAPIRMSGEMQPTSDLVRKAMFKIQTPLHLASISASTLQTYQGLFRGQDGKCYINTIRQKGYRNQYELTDFPCEKGMNNDYPFIQNFPPSRMIYDNPSKNCGQSICLG